MRKYAGIGSRETTDVVLDYMADIGKQYAEHGWLLRSGHAGGADLAFELGCDHVKGAKEIFIPWNGFNGAWDRPNNSFHVPEFNRDLMELASQLHPAWDRCNAPSKKLHARNGCQILGAYLDDPVDLVICWTKNASGTGGTGQAIRIAKSHGIPVIDLGLNLSKNLDLLEQYMTQEF